MVPLFFYGANADTSQASRQCAIHVLFSCATTCTLSLLPPSTQMGGCLHFLIVNCFMIKEKLEIVRPLPDYTRNFLFRVNDSISTGRRNQVATANAAIQSSPVEATRLPNSLSTLSRAMILGNLGNSAASVGPSASTAPNSDATSRRVSKRKLRSHN